MTDQRRIARRTRNAAAAALVTVLAVSTAACSKSADPSPVASSAQPSSTSSKPSVDIADVQKFLAEVPNWGADDWKKWASQNGFKPEDFATIKHFWDQEKPVAPRGGTSVTPEKQAPSLQKVVLPPSVPAKAVPHPYSPDTALLGRIILKNAEGEDHSCSGTVVTDPQHPGKSNLVWTAAHCVHGGKGSDYDKQLMFLPGYNRSGASSHGKQPEDWQDIAPLGRWVAQNMVVPPQWTREGLHVGNQASQFDFAIVRVAPLDDTRSLEEAVGGSVPIAFNLKQADITAPKAYGYPADSPFDGEELEHCDSSTALVPFTYNPSRPPMLIMGCTMTGGSSGGGWLTKQGGKAVLFSNVSIGDPVSGWQAGPTLGPEAKNLFDAFVSG
ncbi:trypsin-like serine peptidase [Kitasatospora sp. NPDC004272]